MLVRFASSLRLGCADVHLRHSVITTLSLSDMIVSLLHCFAYLLKENSSNSVPAAVKDL